MEKRTEDLHKLIEKLKGMGINCGDSLDGLDSVVAGLQVGKLMTGIVWLKAGPFDFLCRQKAIDKFTLNTMIL